MSAHSSLTGSDLHEPKGAASAASGSVYVSNGSGSGSWVVPVETFVSRLLHVFSASNASVAATTGAWTTKAIASVRTNSVATSSLSGNQVTLPAGTYFVQGFCDVNTASDFQIRLRNITDSTTIFAGSYQKGDAAVASSMSSRLSGQFTIAASKLIEMQYFTTAAGSLSIVGATGETPVTAELLFWKII